MKKIVVTGGLGFIGSPLVASLRTSLDNAVFVMDVRDGYDIRSQEFTDALLRFDPNEIYHLAAMADIGWCIEHPREAEAINVGGTRKLIEAADRLVDLQRFTFLSTASVYGTSAEPISEAAELHPSNVYAQSKIECEILVKTLPIEPTIIRLFNPIGVGASPTQIVPRLLSATETGEKMTISDPHVTRDYIWIGDAVKAIAGAPSGVFNVGTGVGTSIAELVEIVERVTGNPVPHEVVGSEPGRNGNLVADSSKMRAVGWTPIVSVEEGIRKIWERH